MFNLDGTIIYKQNKLEDIGINGEELIKYDDTFVLGVDRNGQA